jgi:hypothetical protein
MIDTLFEKREVQEHKHKYIQNTYNTHYVNVENKETSEKGENSTHFFFAQTNKPMKFFWFSFVFNNRNTKIYSQQTKKIMIISCATVEY